MSLTAATVVALLTYAQPLWHAADQLLHRAVLLARPLLAVTLKQLGRPLLELLDADFLASDIVRLLTFGEVAAQPCPHSLDRVEVPGVW